MPVTLIRQDELEALVAATEATTSAPSTSGFGFLCFAPGGRVRTFFDFAGSVTSCTVRLWTRVPGTTTWYSGVSTSDLGGFRSSSGVLVDQSFDWDIGENMEFFFQIEAIAPGTSNNTIAINAAGVQR